MLNYVFSKTRDILTDYQKDNQAIINEVVLTGGAAILSGVDMLASEALNLDVRRADPFGKLDTPGNLEYTLKEIGPEFAVSIGAALRRLRQ